MWWQKSWEFGGWNIEFDLTMVGIGIGYAYSTKSLFATLPFVLVVYRKG